MLSRTLRVSRSDLARVVLFWIVALLARGAHAAPGAADWLDRYVVVSGCPDEGVFRAAVQRRVSGPLDAALQGQRLGVTIERFAASGSESLSGQLRVTDATGFTSAREIQGNSCAEVVEALSLVAALSGQAMSSGLTHDAPLSRAPSVAERLDAEPQDRSPPRVAEAPAEAVRLGPAVFVVMQSAAAPRPALGAGLGLSMEWPRVGRWAPWLQVGAYQLRGGEIPLRDTGVRAHFDLLAAHAVACPLRLPARGAWSLQPCADLDLGRLTGSGAGSAVLRATPRAAWWASTGLALRAEVTPWGPVRISTSLGFTLPWNRHEFVFAPDTVAFRVPALGWRGAFSGALMF